mgnify:CR=1 FL=1
MIESGSAFAAAYPVEAARLTQAAHVDVTEHDACGVGMVAALDGVARREVVQAGIDNVYDRFKTLAAQARKRTPEQIDAVGQGRVWTGAQALERGLREGLQRASEASS